MKKIALLIIFITTYIYVSGQEYFDKYWTKCSSDTAFYFVTRDKTGGNCHHIKMKHNGKFSKEYLIYKTDDFRNGECTRFRKNGDTVMHFFYKDAKRDGLLRIWKKRGHLYKKAFIKDDFEDGITEYYYPNSKISAKYLMEKGKVVESTFWNEDGSELNDVRLANVRPKFQGKDENAFIRWVATRLIYPPDCVRLNIEGTVLLTFKISAKGLVREVTAIKSPHFQLEAEAIRVVESSPAWTPAVLHNQVSEIILVFPVIFKKRGI
jgi:TonB family protein